MHATLKRCTHTCKSPVVLMLIWRRCHYFAFKGFFFLLELAVCICAMCMRRFSTVIACSNLGNTCLAYVSIGKCALLFYGLTEPQHCLEFLLLLFRYEMWFFELGMIHRFCSVVMEWKSPFVRVHFWPEHIVFISTVIYFCKNTFEHGITDVWFDYIHLYLLIYDLISILHRNL